MLLILSVFFSIYLINIRCCNLRRSVARLWEGLCVFSYCQFRCYSQFLFLRFSPREFSGFTPQSASSVLLRKIPSEKSFNWLFPKYLPTNNHNQCQLHDKGKIRVRARIFHSPYRIPRQRKQEQYKLEMGKQNSLIESNTSHVFFNLEKSEITEFWDLFHLWHYSSLALDIGDWKSGQQRVALI